MALTSDASLRPQTLSLLEESSTPRSFIKRFAVKVANRTAFAVEDIRWMLN
ncbi:MAG TPA: hypothetical protein VGY48_23675 [Vicinamibacterales bacterium]|nr:hypothetical protein [Vicinamibacterales bacterium]